MSRNENALKLEELSALAYSAQTLGDEEPWDVLIVSFEGEYGHGCTGNGDGGFLHAVMVLAHELWPHRGTILDLRSLNYQWGDWIGNALRGNPLGILISDRCRTGLTRYVKAEMGKNPADYLFESTEEAIESVRQRTGMPLASLRPVRRLIQERSALKIHMEAVPLGPQEFDRALLIGVRGDWQPSDARFVKGHAQAWLVGWNFSAIVFDFRGLRYRKGREMADVLTLGKEDTPERKLLLQVFGQAGDEGYPGKDLTRVLVSDLSRDGIQHCLQNDLLMAPSGWIFDDLESAVRSLAGQTRPGPSFLPIE